MWPLERKPAPDVIRITRRSVERWREDGIGLRLIGTADLRAPEVLASPTSADLLAEGLVRLLEPTTNPTAKGHSDRAHLVLESAWLPALPLGCEARLWRDRRMEALLRHRLARLHGHLDSSVDLWSLQVDFRAGDACAIGYGLAPTVLEGLERAARTTGQRWLSIQPALSWGWRRLHGRLGGSSLSTWLFWLEADRALACLVHRGQLLGMNPSVSLESDTSGWVRHSQVESARLGLPHSDRACLVVGWSETRPATPDGQVTCMSIGHIAPMESAASAGFPLRRHSKASA